MSREYKMSLTQARENSPLFIKMTGVTVFIQISLACIRPSVCETNFWIRTDRFCLWHGILFSWYLPASCPTKIMQARRQYSWLLQSRNFLCSGGEWVRITNPGSQRLTPNKDQGKVPENVNLPFIRVKFSTAIKLCRVTALWNKGTI